MFITAEAIRLEAMRQSSRQKTNKNNPNWDPYMHKALQVSINDLVILQQVMDTRFSLVMWTYDNSGENSV